MSRRAREVRVDQQRQQALLHFPRRQPVAAARVRRVRPARPRRALVFGLGGEELPGALGWR